MRMMKGATVLALSLLAAPLFLGVAAVRMERAMAAPFDGDEPDSPEIREWTMPFEESAA
jgi:hypothetical protein